MENSDDLPDLETPFELAKKLMIDRQKLPVGDPNKQFEESSLEAAMANRQKALQIYKDSPDEALLLISDCIEMFPCSSIYLNTRAEIFRHTGDVQLAIRDLKLADKRAPGGFKTYRLLSELLFDCQEFDDCLKFIQKALQLENDSQLSQLKKECVARQKEQTERQKLFED